VLFHITPLERVWFAARVFEQDLGALKLGQSIEVSSKANPQKYYPGKLVFIDRVVDPATRTILARFEVDNPNRELLPEMSATGSVAVGAGEPVLTIPESALIDTGKRKLVYVKTGEATYEQREVNVGHRGGSAQENTGSLVEIISGIKEGEPVVIAGTFLIDAEAQLRNSK
jgi:Cu(I)/Ag(I) efflux system membrane fusion protein